MEGYSDSRTATFVHMPEEELRARGLSDVEWLYIELVLLLMHFRSLQMANDHTIIITQMQ